MPAFSNMAIARESLSLALLAFGAAT